MPGASNTSLSVVIRVRDEARSLGRLLALLAAQGADHETVVVDSGSRDGSRDVALASGARVIDVEPSEFSFGGALNLGVAQSSGDVVVALSAHAFPRSDRWLEHVGEHFGDSSVACVFGIDHDDRFQPLAAPVRLDATMLERNPYWGYSNGAGAFRRSLWERRGFREDMPGTEDREWSWWALHEGHVCVLDPQLAVDHDHTRDSLRSSYERYRREYAGYAMFLDVAPYGRRDLLAEWWGEQGGHRSRVRARLDPRRFVRLLGKRRGLGG